MHNDKLKSVGLAWIGVLSSFTLAEFIQVWVGILAGVLASIYTSLKIWDWIRELRKGK